MLRWNAPARDAAADFHQPERFRVRPVVNGATLTVDCLVARYLALRARRKQVNLSGVVPRESRGIQRPRHHRLCLIKIDNGAPSHEIMRDQKAARDRPVSAYRETRPGHGEGTRTSLQLRLRRNTRPSRSPSMLVDGLDPQVGNQPRRKARNSLQSRLSALEGRSSFQGKDVDRASRRHVGIFSGKQQVEHSLHAGGVHAPARLNGDVLLAVDRKRYRHAIDAR